MATSAGAALHLKQRDRSSEAVLRAEEVRLRWLGGRGGAPIVQATAVLDGGPTLVLSDHALAVALGSPLAPVGPEVVVRRLAAALAGLHALDPAGCPGSAGLEERLEELRSGIEAGHVRVRGDGPFARYRPERLLELFDVARPAPPDQPVVVHGRVDAGHVLLTPDGTALAGLRSLGVGDRHLDLAAAALTLVGLFGPEVLPLFFDSYGLARPDPARLDAYSLLAAFS